ncbi:efflux RND transporter permease subunit [Cyclobacterium qasimii]|uniref:efflux RND transporter permease subunit n=1 Tax=Cyclobacterium qasimii TaxID=1350429 RepID=UPI0021CD73B8|nr:efflux RND transporter permease subunit [Cyclobacterium qasimii]
MDRFTSASSENTAAINVEAIKGYDIDILLADVKNAVDKVPSFPAEMEPPVVAKNENLNVAIELELSGKDIPLKTLKTIGREIENDLRSIDGISQITITGFPDEEITVSVNEEVLRSYNLTFSDVANAVANNNILVTGGAIKTEAEDYLIRVNNRSYYGKELNNIILKTEDNGAIVTLEDVAVTEDAWSETPDRSYYNNQSSISFQISTTNNEDLIEAAENATIYSEAFNETHNNIQLNVTNDRSQIIVERTKLLMVNGAQGIALVLFFLSLFLRPRLAAWVAFGIPISFLGMFMMASYFDITINVLSLFGMIIVIGILVDDGIVIAENIFHHYEKGKSRVQAAIDGTMEVLPAITSAILTTLVAFSTFFYLDGRLGEFFGEVSIVVILTLSFSLFEALVILPAHIAHSKALSKDQKMYWFNERATTFLDYLRDKLYSPVLHFFMEFKILGFSILIALFVITTGAMEGGIIRTTFFPVVASDQVNVTLKMPQGINPLVTESIISEIEQVAIEVNKEYTAKQEGGKEVFQSIIKRTGPGTANASLKINLLPGEERDFTASEIAGSIAQASGEYPSAESLTFDAGSSFGGKPVSVSLLGYNIEELKAAKLELKEKLKENTLLRDISDNDPAGINEINVELKDKAYLLGFTLSDVIGQVRAGFNGLQVQRFQRGQDEIIVWVRYDRAGRSSILNLDNMHIVSASGNRVPLSEIATYFIERGEITINHLDGKREIKVEADLKDPKESSSDIITDVRENIMPEIMSKYPTVSALYEGQNREAGKISASASKVFPIIIFLILIIIGFTFRSYLQPILLLVMIPFSLIGVAWGHWLHDFPINMLSLLGIIALIGIVVNDGLVLISKFNSYLQEGFSFDDALIQAGKSRFRAIFLTSITTIAGLSPLILEKSRQAQFLIPMAIAIAYGIAIATVLTLIMLPMLLSVGNGLKVYTIWLWEGKKPSKESVEPAIEELEELHENDELTQNA